eukprot:g29315.t1
MSVERCDTRTLPLTWQHLHPCAENLHTWRMANTWRVPSLVIEFACTQEEELANANRLPEAIESFKAAARFVGEHVSFANLGVAYMRNKEFGLAYKALRKAIALNPEDTHAVENLEVLQSFASSHGYDRKKLEALGRKAELDLLPSSARAEEEVPRSGREHRILNSPALIGRRAKELEKRGEKKVARGYLSLALHMNPWVGLEVPWVDDMVFEERSRMTYWTGDGEGMQLSINVTFGRREEMGEFSASS